MTVARASSTVLLFWTPPDVNDPPVSLVSTQGRIESLVASSEDIMTTSSVPDPLAFDLLSSTWSTYHLDPLIPGTSVLWRFQAKRSGTALSLADALVVMSVTRVEGSSDPQDLVFDRQSTDALSGVPGAFQIKYDADQDIEDTVAKTGRGWYDVRFSPGDEIEVALALGDRLYYQITAQLNTGDVLTLLRGRIESYEELPIPVVTNITTPTSHSGYYECDVYSDGGFASLSFLVQLGDNPKEWVTAYTDGEFRGVFKPGSTRTGLGTEAVPYHFKIKPLGFWPDGSNVVRPRAIDTSGNANVS